MSWWALAWAPLELALNRVVSLDAQASTRLADLEGKAIAVELDGLPRVVVGFQRGALRVFPETSSATHVTLSAALADVLGAAATDRGRATSPLDSLNISGDVATVRALKNWVDGFHVDWEARVAEAVGPELARPIVRVVAGVRDWARSAGTTLRDDVAEYLRHETDVVPGADEAATFRSDVDELRARVDQLAAKLNRVNVAAAKRGSS